MQNFGLGSTSKLVTTTTLQKVVILSPRREEGTRSNGVQGKKGCSRSIVINSRLW